MAVFSNFALKPRAVRQISDNYKKSSIARVVLIYQENQFTKAKNISEMTFFIPLTRNNFNGRTSW